MTHTLHRRGDPDGLAKDYVILTTHAKGINFEGSGKMMRKFFEIVMKHDPVIVGDGGRGNQITLGAEALFEGITDRTTGHAVFRDADVVAVVLKELLDSGFDRSVVVSGLFEEVKECCHKAGLGVPHTIEYSLGTWGKTSKLPSHDEQEITTMCGHAQVPASLVRHLATRVRSGRISPQEAALTMARQCPCGIFNTDRAAELIASLAARLADS